MDRWIVKNEKQFIFTPKQQISETSYIEKNQDSDYMY